MKELWLLDLTGKCSITAPFVRAVVLQSFDACRARYNISTYRQKIVFLLKQDAFETAVKNGPFETVTTIEVLSIDAI